jgi:nucleotide-binding universal stress UspA family protein
MKMLICSDGSEQGERAARFGAGMAAACQSDVTLLGILEGRGDSKLVLDSLNRSLRLLEEKKVKAELISRSGKPIDEIIRQTEQSPYDLVVIGAAQKERRGLFWMSSKSYRIIKEVKPPVLSVAGKSAGLKRMLICSGGKHYIENAIQLAGGIAKAMASTVTLLHVLPEAPGIYSTLPRIDEGTDTLLKSKSELGRNLRRGKELLQALSVPVEVRLRHGPVLQEILREIKQGNYDLVVTGSAPSRTLRTYVLGDITREIMNHTTCAVLVVRSEHLEDEHFRLGGWFGSKRPRKSRQPPANPAPPTT